MPLSKPLDRGVFALNKCAYLCSPTKLRKRVTQPKHQWHTPRALGIAFVAMLRSVKAPPQPCQPKVPTAVSGAAQPADKAGKKTALTQQCAGLRSRWCSSAHRALSGHCMHAEERNGAWELEGPVSTVKSLVAGWEQIAAHCECLALYLHCMPTEESVQGGAWQTPSSSVKSCSAF